MTGTKLPARILMATALRARCDRALTRAAAPARARQREPTVAQVVDAAAVTQQCNSHRAAAARPTPIETALHRMLEHGRRESLRSADQASAAVDRVVLGSQGRSGLARSRPGSRAERLLHALDCHMLVVRGA
jgi:nucleotide-binding universal stress UspA family protein